MLLFFLAAIISLTCVHFFFAAVDLTGGVHICTEMLRKEMATNEFWRRLQYYTSSGCYFMGVSKSGDKIEGETDVGVVTRHAYSILECAQTSKGDKLIKIRNPWGEQGLNCSTSLLSKTLLLNRRVEWQVF